MPDVDLPPGDYRERKPKGWRWRLPWSHEEDVKLPFLSFLVMGGFVAYGLLNLPHGTSLWIVGGCSVFAFLGGASFARTFWR